MATFTKDVEEIRQRAEQKIEEGAVTDSYTLDKDRSIEILNEALATEIVCVLRYQHHYFMATGVHGKGVAEVFKEHADEEREHTEELAERIQQLGGKPNFNPGDLVARSVSQYVEGESLGDMIREDLIAERMVIDVYQRMIEYFGMKDPTTRALLEHIKAEEEEHASELSDFLFIVDPATGEEKGQDPGSDPLRMESRNGSKQKSESSKGRPAGTSAESRESDEDDIEVEELTASTGWGNEAHIGQAGQGGPRKTLNPPQTNWGNESHRGSESGNRKANGNERSQEEESLAGNKGSQTKRTAETKGTTRQAGRGVDRSGSDKKNTNITNRPSDERVTPKAARGEDLSGGKKKQPASNTPGVGGRTMNRRRNETPDIDTSEVAERSNRGASSGGTRSPRLLQKNRKGKKAA